MQALANLPTSQIAVLVFILLAFCAFGITLFAVALSTELSARQRPPALKREVTPARGVSAASH